ncbi:MAG: UDP-N-acetylglucosamine 2-epimerase (hydrolyzing), partial [Candidatus Omnitrophica bacterium]|nr:UDP-N-acetylglucosamine 2-epimerase (hydrolyzing) [Candidatus Omnitrophota bacterium]
MKRKICVITGSRAEYGLLQPLLEELKKNKEFQLQIVVTGMHLSKAHGLTFKVIEKDNFRITKKVNIQLTADTSLGITRSMGYAVSRFGDAFVELNPDLIICLGDRYEIFSAVASALIHCIPVAHISGGELTEGAFDDALRHSITKMSHIHFTATEEYRNRVIQLGEQPNSVYNVGALGLDNIYRLKLLSKAELEKQLKFQFKKRNLLVTFHPVTLEKESVKQQFQNLLKALDSFEETQIIFTKANADTNGSLINMMIEQYCKKKLFKAVWFTSLGQLRYLSVLRYVDAMIGNSSSGMVEAPSFQIPTVNIGDRQKGRNRVK